VGLTAQKSTSILYFEKEGRENLPQVLRVIKKQLTKRIELRAMTLVMLTATGDGPALAYARLNEFSPKIIAVTFPPDFSITRGEETINPQIPERLKQFFTGVGVTILTNRLPFDAVWNARGHNADMQLIKDVLTIFGGGFPLCVQAVLSACDHGKIAVGEKVLSVTGDTAAIITATTTQKFVSKADGLVINEILCKARNFTISRTEPTPSPVARKPLPAELPKEKIIDVAVLPYVKPRTRGDS
jgi:hypothetical protein